VSSAAPTELRLDESEAVVQKRFGDSFEDTDLEDVLAAAGVGHLVVSGAQTDEYIRSTIHGAITRGYDVTLARIVHDWRADSSRRSTEVPVL